MRVIESCAECLYDKQKHLSDDPAYLDEVKQILADRRPRDTAPYLVYLFTQAYERRFGKKAPFRAIKQTYNDLVLSMEDAIREKIASASDPLATALACARVGNYIDFGAMNSVEESVFLALFDSAELSEQDRVTYRSFLRQCERARTFLLIADNCGEIVLDKLFLQQLKQTYPQLDMTVMVRGDEVLNDATEEDARYVQLDRVASVISNGSSIAGTVYELLPHDAKEAFDRADVILAKGQGNYESICGQGHHVFYSFLCKCELFTNRFQVPKLTGMFLEES